MVVWILAGRRWGAPIGTSGPDRRPPYRLAASIQHGTASIEFSSLHTAGTASI